MAIDTETTARVLKAIKAAGAEGISLKDLESKTGIRYRILHNVTWVMEGSPREGTLAHRDQKVIKRVNTGRTVLYAALAKGEPEDPTMRGKYATRGSVEA